MYQAPSRYIGLSHPLVQCFLTAHQWRRCSQRKGWLHFYRSTISLMSRPPGSVVSY